MDKNEFKLIHLLEDSHFYYVGNRKLFLSLVEKYFTSSRKIKILDAGCGTGHLGKKLLSMGDVWGVDISSEALKYAKSSGLKLIKSSVTDLPFEESFFDVVVSLDTIYHRQVASDILALQEMFRVLKKGGIIVLRVPANKWLRLTHDKRVGTRERYNKRELSEKLEATGFNVTKISYINAILLPLALVFPNQKLRSLPRIPNWLLTKILILEGKLLNFIDLPFGLGLLAVGKKV